MNSQLQGELFWEAHLYLSALVGANIKCFEKRQIVLTLLEEDACEILMSFPDMEPHVFFYLLMELYKIKSSDSFINSVRSQTSFFKVVIQDKEMNTYKFPTVCINSVFKSRYNETHQDRSARLCAAGKYLMEYSGIEQEIQLSVFNFLQAITSQYYFLDENDIKLLLTQLIPLGHSQPNYEIPTTTRLRYTNGELTLHGDLSQNSLT